jgi:hypothetical protein
MTDVNRDLARIATEQQTQNTLKFSQLQLIIQMVFKQHSKNSRGTSGHQTELK